MKDRLITLNVNDEDHSVVVDDRDTLLHVLRNGLFLTGTKEACGTGECGACTILLDDRPVLACLTLAVAAQGKRIRTIEGLAHQGKLTPLQQAFVEYGAVQCGFCSPGMILSATSLLEENPHATRTEIQKALEGNLCRCTGYNKIIEAIERVRDSQAQVPGGQTNRDPGPRIAIAKHPVREHPVRTPDPNKRQYAKGHRKENTED